MLLAADPATWRPYPELPWLDLRGEAAVGRRRLRARDAACCRCVRERRRGDSRAALQRAKCIQLSKADPDKAWAG